MTQIMYTKANNIELLGYLKLGNYSYSVQDLINHIELTASSEQSAANGSIQYVSTLPTSNISDTTIYVVGEGINLYNGTDWISITGKSIKNIPITNQNVTTTDYTISWNGSIVTITHNMNSRLICSLYDNNNNQVFLGVNYIDNNNISINFSDIVINNNETYVLSLISQYALLNNFNTDVINTYGLKQQYPKQASSTITTTSITVTNENSVYIYNTNISSAKTFTFTWPDSTAVYNIELWLNMTTASALTLSGVTWINDPDFTNTGIYCICLRKMPSSFDNGAVYANIAYCV